LANNEVLDEISLQLIEFRVCDNIREQKKIIPFCYFKGNVQSSLNSVYFLYV